MASSTTESDYQLPRVHARVGGDANRTRHGRRHIALRRTIMHSCRFVAPLFIRSDKKLYKTEISWHDLRSAFGTDAVELGFGRAGVVGEGQKSRARKEGRI